MGKSVTNTQQPVIMQYLEKYKDQIAAALPKHLTADRMARIIMTEVRKTPELMQCDPRSLFGAVIQASQLGLEPGSALGHAYLIPFKKDISLIIGYRGMIDLARRSGQINSIVARAVYECDEFTYSYGLHDKLEHKPSQIGDRGKLTHVYAIAKLKDGGVQWEVMTKSEVDAIRAQSKAGRSGPWVTHYDEMAKKTVVRRLFKYLPVSIELQQAIGIDEQADAGISQRNDAVIDGVFESVQEEEPATSKTESIKQRLSKYHEQENDTETTLDLATLIMQIEQADSDDKFELAEDLINFLPKDKDKETAAAILHRARNAWMDKQR